MGAPLECKRDDENTVGTQDLRVDGDFAGGFDLRIPCAPKTVGRATRRRLRNFGNSELFKFGTG